MPIADIWIAVLAGLFSGLAVNYLADVLPWTRRFSWPECHTCSQRVRPVDFLLNRRCPSCGAGRSWRYWAVMAIFLALSLFTWRYPSRPMGYPLGMALLIWLGVVVVIDLEFRVVLNEVSAVGAVLGLAVGVLGRGVLPTLEGGLAGFAIMAVFYFLGMLYVRWLGKRRRRKAPPAEAAETAEKADEDEVALGFGDVNLSAILGFILGWPAIVAGLLAGVLAGGVISLLYILVLVALRKYHLSIAIPYAPFLVLGAAALLYGLWAL